VTTKAAIIPETPSEQTFRALLKTMGMLRRIMEPYFSRYGISGSQWGVMRALWNADQAGEAIVRVTDLSDRLLIRPPSVTTVVDRLERQGLVLREGSHSDQRVKEVRLTDAGKKVVRRVLHGHTSQIETLLDGLTAPELHTLRQSLDRLNMHLAAINDGGEPHVQRKSGKANRKDYEVD
jgi:MarR family 2-MHQ and catechol resistance regulon transcriptional repressor